MRIKKKKKKIFSKDLCQQHIASDHKFQSSQVLVVVDDIEWFSIPFIWPSRMRL